MFAKIFVPIFEVFLKGISTNTYDVQVPKSIITTIVATTMHISQNIKF